MKEKRRWSSSLGRRVEKDFPLDPRIMEWYFSMSPA